MAATRVLVAENHALIREMIVRVLDQHADIEVVGLASDGTEAVDAASRLAPDVVVLDMSVPGLRAFEATRQIRELTRSTAVLILGTDVDEIYVNGALEAGASGYLSTIIQSRELVEAVLRVGRGEIVCPARSARAAFAPREGRSRGSRR